MAELNEKEEIKSVSGKVLAFGMAAVTLLVVVICGCLLIALYSMSSRYLEQIEIAQDRQQTISAMRRALDRAEGKLEVYEEFLNDRREEIVHKMIVKYLRREKVKSTDATLKDFEQWVGIGIGGR
jgi:predicted DNA-binding protein YlxM (UPF0122 family)